MSSAPLDWRKSLDQHYQSLLDFTDAPTIRTMHGMITRSLDTDEAIIAAIDDPDAKAEFIKAFEAEHEELKALRAELEAWLASKGLTL